MICPVPYTINIRGQLMDLSYPRVMGILNVTPDSFFAGSRKQTEAEIADRVVQIVAEGGSIIDVGGFSTRPGAQEVSSEEEIARLRRALPLVHREAPDIPISVDTYRPEVARVAVEELGADIINDVSEGGLTGIVDTPLTPSVDEIPAMFRMVGQLKVPYILMSVQANLSTMLSNMAKEVGQLHKLGVKDIIIDPGFGFGKSMDENYKLLGQLEQLRVLQLPMLVGVSRKRMIHQLLGVGVDEALNGTTVVHTLALGKGTSILRVHDVKAAVETVKIYRQLCLSTLE